MSETRRLHGLDAMRGLAALAVVGFHAHDTFDAFPAWWSKGYLAVDFFMVLSGYVMARTYEARMAGGLSARTFLTLRYRRLWPTMAIGGLIGIPYLWWVAGDPAWFALALVLNLALLPAPLNAQAFPLNLPAWSVFYELVANLIHSLFLHKLDNAKLLIVIAALLSVMSYLAHFKGDVDFGAFSEQFVFAILRCLLPYSIGVLLWRLWQDEPTLKVPPALAIAALPVLLLSPFAALGWFYDIAFIALACPLLIAGGLRMQGAPRWAVWSGLLSFPLYAVHMPVLRLGEMYGIDPLLITALAVMAGALAAWWLSARGRRAKAPVTT